MEKHANKNTGLRYALQLKRLFFRQFDTNTTRANSGKPTVLLVEYHLSQILRKSILPDLHVYLSLNPRAIQWPHSQTALVKSARYYA
jgi:hypothetical protein